jgi:hypothetical protein
MQQHLKRVLFVLLLPVLLLFALGACQTIQEVETLPLPGEEGVPAPDPTTPLPGMVGAPALVDQTTAPVTAYAAVVNAQHALLPASELLNYIIVDPAGQPAGDLQDLLLDAATGRILYAIVTYTQLHGESRLAMPLNALVWQGGSLLALNVSDEWLASYPVAEDGDVNWTAPAWQAQVAEFWRAAAFEPGIMPGQQIQTIMAASQFTAAAAGPLALGTGRIDDLLVDLSQGRAVYLVIDDPALGAGLLTAVPFSILDAVPQPDGQLLLSPNIHQEAIVAAPVFERDLLALEGLLPAGFDNAIAAYWQDLGFDPAEPGAPGLIDAQVPPPGTAPPLQQEGAAAGAPPPGQALAGAQDGLIPATLLLSYNFENIDGEVAGVIEDLLVETRSGRILYVMVRYGGILNIGATALPAPLNAFVWGPQNELVLNIEEQFLTDLSDLGVGWPDLANPDWDNDLNAFWRSVGIDPGAEVTDESGIVLTASVLIGTPIGEPHVGVDTIHNLLIDLTQGQVPYAIVNHGTMSTVANLILVPFHLLDFHSVRGHVVYHQDLDPAQLEGAPRVQEPSLAADILYEPFFRDEADAYWGEPRTRP